MQKELDYMIGRFPRYRARVIELFNCNDDFKSLCDDYWQCHNNLYRLNEQANREPRLENGYKMLSLTLEQEVLHFLND